MTLAEIYSALENVENGNALITGIKAELAKANNDARGNREAKEKAETTLQGLQAQLAELQKENEGYKAESGSKNSELAELQKQVQALMKSNEEAKARAEAENKARIDAEILSQVVDSLTKSNAMDPQEFAGLITPKIKVGEDGSYGYVKQDGTNGTIADATAEWLSGKPWAVKSTQNHGSGDGKGPNQPQGVDAIAKEFGDALGI